VQYCALLEEGGLATLFEVIDSCVGNRQRTEAVYNDIPYARSLAYRLRARPQSLSYQVLRELWDPLVWVVVSAWILPWVSLYPLACQPTFNGFST
jgi:hypothetical protein